MKIENIINLVESALYEISQAGSQSATAVSNKDFEEIRELVQKIKNHFDMANVEIDLTHLASDIKTILSGSAKEYILGKSGKVELSPATSSMRGDAEQRSAAFAGPERTNNISMDKAERMTAVAQVLDEEGYLNIDENRGKVNFTDRSGMSRISHFLQLNIKYKTLAELLQNFDEAKRKFQSINKQRMAGNAGKEEEFEGADVVKQLNLNILIFLSQVSKNHKAKQSWDKPLNPANYEKVDSKVTGYFKYDPRTAAESLVSMGLAKKGDNGYLLNKDKIRKVVGAAKEEIGGLLKDAKVENPSQKDGGITNSEQRARKLINFMKRTFSDQIWENGQKHVFAAMREQGGDHANALQWYLGAKDSVGDDDNDSGVSAKLEQVNKTLLGTIIDFATAKYIARKMLNHASTVLNKNARPRQLIKDGDIRPAAKAFRAGNHKRNARI